MANVQKENGYTEVANELMEALARADLSGSEYKVVLYIIRSTYGWKRKTACLSVEEIAVGTGQWKDTTAEAVRSLRRRNILTAEGDNYHPKTYSIQKDYEQWLTRSDQPQLTSSKSPVGTGDQFKVTSSKSSKSPVQTGHFADSHSYSNRLKEKKESGSDGDRPIQTGKQRADAERLRPSWQNLAVKIKGNFPNESQYTVPMIVRQLEQQWGEKGPTVVDGWVSALIKAGRVDDVTVFSLWAEYSKLEQAPDWEKECRETQEYLDKMGARPLEANKSA